LFWRWSLFWLWCCTRRDKLQPVEDLAQLVIAPVQRSFDGLVNSTGDLFGLFREVRELRAETGTSRTKTTASAVKTSA